MKLGIWKHVALAAVIALAFYAAMFWGIEYRRTRNGPWELTFAAGESNEPSLTITEPRLGITGVRLIFPDDKLPGEFMAQTRRFDQPTPTPFDLPFGRCIYMDAMSLPGVVTFDFFGHEIEIMPRTLVVDKKQIAWKAGETIRVTGPRVNPQPPKGR